MMIFQNHPILAATALILLGTAPTGVTADAGIKADVTDAVCSNGMTLSDYTVECVDDDGETAVDCALGQSANINANLYIDNEIPEGDGGRFVAVMVEGCLGYCDAVVDSQGIEICNEEEEDDDDDEEEEEEDEDNQEARRKLSSSSYTFASSGGQECGEAGGYALSVNGFKLDTFGIRRATWGYGGKDVTLLLTLTGSDKVKSQNSQDNAEGEEEEEEEATYDAIGYCEITLRTEGNPPQLYIAVGIAAIVCGAVFFMMYRKEKKKSSSRQGEMTRDFDLMKDQKKEEPKGGWLSGLFGGKKNTPEMEANADGQIA